MGNCSKCTINESEDTLNNTMKISSDTIIGEYTKINQISSLCCCKSNLHCFISFSNAIAESLSCA